ncbi:DUF3027 domain-containing protein [Arthrobacter sp. L77]|uniref:DUF3027 domain-containing protein n=1 Tax=Arthrobacter sp. L77 TaxID=1496689 RepID=UPI00068F4B4A|nr:DUF3027 domain-containing protein [Arthrobacter sp. L77]
MIPSNLDAVDGASSTYIDETPVVAEPGAPAVVEAPRKPRVARRIPKTDSVLEAAVERARQGVLEIAPESQVGRHVSATIDGERLVTHRFEAFVPGYGGWQWYASVARVARSKDVTVCEVGLLPSSASLLAPEWLPWSERVRPEDSPQDEASPSDAAGDAVTTDAADAADAPVTTDAPVTVDAADTTDAPVTADAADATDAGVTPVAGEDDPETSAAEQPDAE